jgi:uncharacterized protein (TIGR00255 family)
MIYSMTGYGRAEAAINGKKITVELNSLNNRFREVQIRLPRSLSHFDPALKEIVAGEVSRGKVIVGIIIEESPEASAARLKLDQETASMYKKIFTSLKTDLNIPGELELKDFIGLPDLIKSGEEEIDEEELKNLIIECLKSALDAFLKMRGEEGKRLLTDMIGHIDNIEKALLIAEKSAKDNMTQYYKKLEAKLKELVGDISISEDTIATEAAIVAERADITEECVRIKSHLQMFRETYDINEPVGKKMNFILQELYREANTIGSKSIDSEISRNVILMKEEIEKVREQVQNIE